MKKFYLSLLLPLLCFQVKAQIASQNPNPVKANYLLAARFSPKKLQKMIFSTSVDAHWLKNSERFWYMYETSAGKKWYIVDPAARSKKLLFDNAKVAAEVTLIVKDPFDAQHLPIENLKFTKDEKSIQFELKSSVDIVKKDRKDKKAVDSLEKKTFYLQYNLQTGKVIELVNYEKVKPKPMWASIAPDSSAIIFSRNYNLYWMDKANYKKAIKSEDDSTIVEHQLTKDGVKDYAYGGSFMNETNVDEEKNKKKRKPTQVLWSPDAKHFALIKTDSRKLKDFWVINSVTEPRPTLETYKYQLPGEKRKSDQRNVVI